MGIITNYPISEIKEFLERTYGLSGGNIEPTDHGLDNTVYIIRDGSLNNRASDFIFKVVETKTLDEIEASLALAQSDFGKYNRLEFIPALKDRRFVSIFHDSSKPVILSNLIEGEHVALGKNASELDYANFIADFHESRNSYPDAYAAFAKNEIESIKKYWTEEVRKGVFAYTPKRLSLYENLAKQIFSNYDIYIAGAKKHLPSKIGFTHGDLNPGNVIVMPQGGLTAIDYDGASERGFQLVDLFQAAGKSGVSQDIKKLRDFMAAYDSRRGIEHTNLTESSCIQWLSILCFRAAISTEYYTHVIPKLSPEWNVAYASRTIDALLETNKNTMEYLRPGFQG